MNQGSSIPYHLRPHKAIERELFIEILRMLDRCPQIDIERYKYVGFGAPFLEDFKAFHLELGIDKMDCIESDAFAYTRQQFNNPFNFIRLCSTTSTNYITGPDFPTDEIKIVWLDYTSPRELEQQLLDLQRLGERLLEFDIVKFTFNSSLRSFMSSHQLGFDVKQTAKVLKKLKDNPTFQTLLPDETTRQRIEQNFSSVIRSMAVNAIQRGFSTANPDLAFNHLSSFYYADGQQMTTITGIITKGDDFQEILTQSGLAEWRFYLPNATFIEGHQIAVPSMTLSERIRIDKSIPTTDSKVVADELMFRYGEDIQEHYDLIKGYCEFYKYLPYFSKVTY